VGELGGRSGRMIWFAKIFLHYKADGRVFFVCSTAVFDCMIRAMAVEKV